VFTDSYIDINIDDESIKVKGRLEFSESIKYPKTISSPGIMGWYSYIPFMECNHGIVSVGHSLKGKLVFGDDEIDFDNGKGYVEKDWGTSFPEAWIWLHSNSFSNDKTSLFVSVAKIPWLGKFFMGFICFLYVDGKFYRFSTYNNSKIATIHYESNVLTIQIESKHNVLKVVATHQKSGELKAPSMGNMSRRIKESIDSTVHVQLFDRSKGLIYEDNGVRAGLEIIEKIFEYFN
jgi:tocopherol cyclase